MSKKRMISLFGVCAMFFAAICPYSSAFAKGEGVSASEILNCGEFDASEVKKIETNDNGLQDLLETMDGTDGFDDEELRELSIFSDVSVKKSQENDMEITDYIISAKEPLATITTADGPVVYLKEDIMYRSITKDVSWVGGQKVENNVVVQATTKYFYYDIDENNLGRIVKKLYSTEVSLSGTTSNLSKIQMNTYATGIARYDENGVERNSTNMVESRNGKVYNVSGSGPYTEYTTTTYYYPSFQPNSCMYVTIKLTLSDNTTTSFTNKVI